MIAQKAATTDLTRPALVLYADLLGFSRKVESSKTPEERLTLANLLNYFAEQFSGSDIEDADMRDFYAKRFWAFSDSIVVRWLDGSNAQKTMTKFDADLDQLSSIALAQYLIMDSHGQLVRGGVAQGWFLEIGETVLGTALVEAARIEKTIETPFIGVQRELYDRYLEEPGRRHYSEHADPAPRVFIAPCSYTRDLPALDYLSIAHGEIDITDRQRREARAINDEEARFQFENKCWNENRLSFIKWHRDFVSKGLQSSDPRVTNKYDALRQHHDWRVPQLYPGQGELLVHSGVANGPDGPDGPQGK